MHVKVAISVFVSLRAHASTLIIFIPSSFCSLYSLEESHCRPLPWENPAKPQRALISA